MAKYTRVIPEGYTREEYLYLRGEIPAMPEEEPVSFWDKKWNLDPVTGTILTIFSELFFGFLKVFLFFLAEYPKAREEVRQEEAAKTVTSLPRQENPRLVRQHDTK